MSIRSVYLKEETQMLVSVDVITQQEVMRNAVTFRANAAALYGVEPSWEEAFVAVPCASCDSVEYLSNEGFCMDCHRARGARQEGAA